MTDSRPLLLEEQWAATEGAGILCELEASLARYDEHKLVLVLEYFYAFIVGRITASDPEAYNKECHRQTIRRCYRQLSSKNRRAIEQLVYWEIDRSVTAARLVNGESSPLRFQVALAHNIRAARDLYAERGKHGLPKTVKGLLGTAAIVGGLVILATAYVNRKADLADKPNEEED